VAINPPPDSASIEEQATYDGRGIALNHSPNASDRNPSIQPDLQTIIEAWCRRLARPRQDCLRRTDVVGAEHLRHRAGLRRSPRCTSLRYTATLWLMRGRQRFAAIG